MARLLTCPHCHAEFTLEDWARGAKCPSCGKSLSFFEASANPVAAGAAEGAAAADAAAAPSAADPVTTPGSAPPPPLPIDVVHREKPAGRPSGWTTGWTVVAVVVALAAVLLVIVRVGMGAGSGLSVSQQAAIAAVKQAKLPDGTPFGTLLDYQATHDVSALQGVVARKGGPSPRWYAIARPWKHGVYVSWRLPGVGTYSWMVGAGMVTPDAKTLDALEQVDKTMKNPPLAPTGLPSVPGL